MNPLAAYRTVLSAYALAAVSIYAVAATTPGSRGHLYLGLHVVLMGLMIAVWRMGQRLPACHQRTVMWLGIALHIALAAVPPFTSHDTQRYLWDGYTVLQGFDPYVTHPSDATLTALRQQWPTPSEHAQYPTLYPPVALALYALAALAGLNLAGALWQALVTCAAIGVILVVAETLWQKHRIKNIALIALNPLLLLEASVGGHVDVFAALAIALAASATVRKKYGFIGIALGIGALTKLIPLVALIAWVAKKQGARVITAAIAVLVIGYGAALAWGLQPIGSIALFLSQWRFGSPLWSGIESVVPHGAAPYALCLALLAWGWLATYGRHIRPIPSMAIALGILLVCSPVVFPWYLLSLIPLWTLHPTWLGMGWMLTLPLTYEVIDTFDLSGHWVSAAWPLGLIGLAWLLSWPLYTNLAREAQTSPDCPQRRPIAPR